MSGYNKDKLKVIFTALARNEIQRQMKYLLLAVVKLEVDQQFPMILYGLDF
jgi:hypothetical protein